MTAKVDPPPLALYSDRPIRNQSEDRLERRHLAEQIVRHINLLQRSDSYVLGLSGQWGSGKTSLLNLIDELLANEADTIILRAEPWLFSSEGKVVFDLLKELADQLTDRKSARLRFVGGKLQEFSQLFSPRRYLPEPGDKEKEADAGLAATVRSFDSLRWRRRELDEAVLRVNLRFIVLLDSLEQLTAREVHEVFKALRALINLPNTVYVAAFDRALVEAKLTSLAMASGEARAFLQRTCQVIFEVPPFQGSAWATHIIAEINRFIKGRTCGPFNRDDWDAVFYEVMLPLFQTPRQLALYVNSLPLALEQIGAEVALVDVLALEAVRLLLPEAFARLPAALDALTSTEAMSDSRLQAMLRGLQELVRAAGDSAEVIAQMCRRLFPASQRFLGGPPQDPGRLRVWRRGRRVAHPAVLRFYLTRTLPDDTLPAHAIEEMFDALGDAAGLARLLEGLEPELLEHALSRLLDYDHELPEQAAATAVPVILNQSVRLREGLRDGADEGADAVVQRLVQQLLRQAGGEPEQIQAVQRAYPAIPALSRRHLLLQLLGPAGGGPGRPPANAAVRRLEEHLRHEILTAPPERLRDERDLCALLLWAATTPAGTARVRTLLKDDGLFLQLLRTGMTERYVQGEPPTVPMREASLPWGPLQALLSEEVLRSRVQDMVKGLEDSGVSDRTKEAILLAELYLTGWRPRNDAPDALYTGDEEGDIIVLSQAQT